MSDQQSLFLALDQGGHSSRALVLTATGDVVAKAQVPIGTQTLSDTRVEHSAPELAQSLLTCCDEVAKKLGHACAHIKSAGLATQRSSIVCWQRSTGTALTQVLSWQDRRASALIDTHQEQSELVEHLTGLVMSPHYGASKLRWCLDNDRSVQEALAANNLTIGPLASYLVRKLTQSQSDVCDPANASRTLLWRKCCCTIQYNGSITYISSFSNHRSFLIYTNDRSYGIWRCHHFCFRSCLFLAKHDRLYS